MTVTDTRIDCTDLHLPAGSATDGTDPVVVTPSQADWRFTGLRVVELDAGQRRVIATGEHEHAVLPLAGGDVRVEVDGQVLELRGRMSPFERVADVAYVPRDAEVALTASVPTRLALPNAHARRRIDAYRIDARDIPVEIRGSGRATRQLNNFLAPDQGETDRLTAVEVITPRGNWSSHPPHKHDTAFAGGEFEPPAGEAQLEEIYYFELSGGAEGWGLHRTYDLEQGWDVSVAVHSGDVFLVPRGYHGPCVAPPEHDMYYLNVLAGPSTERSLAFSDDPAHAYVRGSWGEMEDDPRVPLYDADGPRSSGSGQSR